MPLLRTPTSREQAYAWHTATLAFFKKLGRNPTLLSRQELSSIVDENGVAWSLPQEPQCGFYKRRLVRGGPWVPARIYIRQKIDPETDELVEDEKMLCQVDGADRDPDEEWLALGARPIEEHEFRYLCAMADWICEYAPDEPQATPAKRINLLTVAPPTFGKERP